MAGETLNLTKEPFLKRFKRPIFGLIGLIFIVVLAVVGWQIFKKPISPSKFSLEASLGDSAGVDPKTVFVLKSAQPISKRVVEKIVKFSPEIEFEVKKTNDKFSFFSSIFAQTENEEPAASVFEIIPKELLSENEVYQVEITDPNYADRDYSWAFQVKALFQVVQTHPRNEGTQTPINSGIEIIFNRENLINPEDYFSIEPKVKGTFEKHGDTLVFLPEKLAAGTIYTVTIRKGLRSQGSDEALLDDYVFAFETGGEEYYGYKAYLDFQNDFLEFAPSKNPTMRIYHHTYLDFSSLEMSVYKVQNADEFIGSYENARNRQWSWSYYYWLGRGSDYRPDEKQKVLSFKPVLITAGYQSFVEIPQALEKGYYVLDVDILGRHSQAWFQITPLAHYFSITHDKGLLWINDFQKKETVENLKVFFYEKTNGANLLGTTNNDGLLEFLTPDLLKEENKSSDNPKFFKVEGGDYLPIIIKIGDKWGYRQEAGKGDLYWDYLSTDRYTYQMNDTLRYWGAIKGREEDLRQKEVSVGIFGGYGCWWYYCGNGEDEPITFQKVLISQFDTIQGELSFKGLSPGYYSVRVIMGDEVISTANIEVLTYSKPLYQITVTPSKNAVFADEKVDFKIKAEFFDGTPVSGLKLEYSGYWYSGIGGEMTLNENGEGNFSYTPKYYEGQYNYYPDSFSVIFSPKLSEEGDISGTANVLVFGPNIYSQSFQEKQADNSYKFTVKLNHIVIEGKDLDASNYWSSRNEYIGDPVSNYPVSAKVIKVTYYKTETGQYYDPIDKVVRKQYYYGSREETIDNPSGTTNSAGEWSFNRSFTQEDDVIYKIVFSGRDDKGREFESYSYAWFSSYSNYDWKEFAVALNINDEANEKQFSVGDRIKLKLQILEGKAPANLKVLFYRYQNNIGKASVELALTFEENFSKEFIPSVQYRAVILGPYGFEESNSVIASFKESDRNLNIDILPSKEKYRPGEEVKINFEVKDKDNKPESAELNVAVVDEALFHILPYDWQRRILESLFNNIYTSPLVGTTEYTFLEKSSGGVERGGCFGAGTPILMADGSSKPIEKIKVGDRILTFKSENERIFEPAVVQGISSHLVDEYLVINNSLKVTPEHRMFINNKWDYAGNIKIGDALIISNGQPQKVYAVERKIENKVYVYNIIVGDYHTYFAGDYFVHNAEKGGKPRINFVDVALYKALHTDKNGEAEVSFTAPDNITAWRTTVIAFSSEEMKAGQEIKLIKTSLPFFVDVALSEYYLVGDKPILRLRAFGDDFRQNQSTQFRVQSESLNLDKKEESMTGYIYFPLGQLMNEGEYELTIWAKQGNLEDSFVKKTQVVKNYFRKSESSIYKLSSNLSAIEGNKDGFTELTFMDAGKGRFYQTLWWYVFTDGLRADQIIANYIGEKLLAQYFNEPEPDEQLDLSSYHIPEGGIGLFPYGDSDLEISAKIADLVPDFVSQNELKNYFVQSLQDRKTDIHRIAKALYGSASLKAPVLVKINLVKNNADLTLEDKVYLSLALVKLGDKEGARKIYRDEIRNQLRFQGQEAWLNQEEDITRRIKLTGTIAVLASYLNEKDDSGQFWNYISTHSPERDLDILETALFMKSELYLAQQQNQKAEFSYKTNKRSDSVVIEKGNVYTLTLSQDELETIKFDNIKGEINLISLYERSKNPDELTKNNELGITRKYFVNNQQVNSFEEGDIVLVRLDPDIAKSAIDGQYQIIDYLPSGLKPITRIYEKGLSGGTECDPIWYPSRVINNVSYFEIYKGFEKPNCQNKTVNYYARVVSKGSYFANPAIIQSLKDLNSLNISSKDSVEIK